MLDVEYTKFKDDTIKGIREDEEQYAELQEQIRALEAEIEAETEARALRDAPTPAAPSRLVDVIEAPKVEKSIINTPRSTEPAPTVSTILGPPVAQPLAPLERILPSHCPQLNDHGPTPEPQGSIPGPLPPNARAFPSQAGLSPMHPPLDLHAANRHPPSGAAPGRGSPLPYALQQQPQFQHQQYPPYNQPQNTRPPQQTYPQTHSPHPGAYYYPSGPPHQGMASANTPILPQFQYYAQSAPVNHYNRNQPQPRQMPMPYPPYAPPGSVGTPPVWRIDGTPARHRASGTSTPWKNKPSNVASLRVPSPERPREVSPLSDVEPPIQAAKTKANTTKSKPKPKIQRNASQKAPENRGIRRGRAGSTASSTVDRSTRSQSMASPASDSKPPPSNKSYGSRKIKPEPTSADAPFPSDIDKQRSSGRRRTRGDTLTSHDAPARPSLKRKRNSVHDSSPMPSSPPYQGPQRQHPVQHPTMVSVSKAFIRVASRLLQRVTEHKHASIFAKALSEREAPGYKGLILRPQDLKSIKAAVTRGSKAAIAAIEEMEQETGPAPILIKITEDLVPPKGIVNMDQLENELMRMFANAIMFNPLPDAERGLGPRRSLRLSSTPSQMGDFGYAGPEEVGIVQDARTMCEDVFALIQTFKEAQQNRMEVEQS